MDKFKEFYNRIAEDVTSGSAFGAAGSGSTGGQFPANNDKAYAPGDARMPMYLGARRGKKRRKLKIQRR